MWGFDCISSLSLPFHLIHFLVFKKHPSTDAFAECVSVACGTIEDSKKTTLCRQPRDKVTVLRDKVTVHSNAYALFKPSVT